MVSDAERNRAGVRTIATKDAFFWTYVGHRLTLVIAVIVLTAGALGYSAL